jgi:hyperosmotically inducible protein
MEDAMKTIVCGCALSWFLLAAIPIGPARAAGPYAPDNTGVNVRDRNSGAMTAGQQSNSSGDLALTQRIRKSIMKDHSLSMMAKNVKIVSANGDVTLRGPVKTEKEKSTVMAKAQAVAGVDRVNDQLEVKSAQ